MKKNITIKTDNLNTVAPLYRQYDGQLNPQPAYINIDPRGDTITVDAGYSSEIGGGISADVWNGLVLRISCPSNILGSSLSGYLEDPDFTKQVLEICDGFEILNQKGCWNRESDDIIRYIEHDLESLEYANIFDGGEWIENDIEYFDDAGETCDYSEATQAKYGDLWITKNNLDDLVRSAEYYIDYDQYVYDIEDAFLSEIERLESNK